MQGWLAASPVNPLELLLDPLFFVHGALQEMLRVSVLVDGLLELAIGFFVVTLDLGQLHLEHGLLCLVDSDLVAQVVDLLLQLAGLLFNFLGFLDCCEFFPAFILDAVPVLLSRILNLCLPLTRLLQRVLNRQVLSFDHFGGVLDHVSDQELSVA